ncbi:MAG: hypothetical protein RR329_02425 [Mucinivorans sp.]
MKKVIYLVALLIGFWSCKEGDDGSMVLQPVKITALDGLPSDSVVFIGTPIKMVAKIENPLSATYEWSYSGKVISREARVEFTPITQGRQQIVLLVNNAISEQKMSADFYVFRPHGEKSSKWISRIIEYRPAPGQFVNTDLGNLSAAQGLIGKRGVVSLGGYGGYIVWQFDHTVVNKAGTDFVVHGNAFEGNSEPGIVMVAYDKNGNGLPDEQEWFELRGSEWDKSTKGYSITYTKPEQTTSAQDVPWSDSKGGKGVVSAIGFHKQCYYPLFLDGESLSLTFTGNVVPKNATANANGIWTLATLKGGYVDNYSEDYAKSVAGDEQTLRSNKFDIDMAVDKDGKKVVLPGVDFIKVYNCINGQAGWLGEISTEVCGAISLSTAQ